MLFAFENYLDKKYNHQER